MPFFKSYSDPLILHYINYFMDMPFGYTFGNQEDSPKIAVVDKIMRKIGLCQLNRHDKKDLFINYINQALIQDVIENNNITTIFQNDTRPRSGKFNQPLNADMMIKMVLKAHRNLQKLKYDIKIVPVCINYDRIFDISFLVGEMVTG